MHLAILGGGSVGGTLGRRLLTLGHSVAFGIREPARGATAIDGGETPDAPLPVGGSVVHPAEAVVGADGRRADAVILATPWNAVTGVLQQITDAHGASAFDGLPLLDATNPLGPQFRVLHGPNGESGAEQVQALVPTAQVVKVFNTTGFGNMANPRYGDVASIMPYAGDAAPSKAIAHELAAALGFDAIDAGPLSRARQLEHLAVLWISLANGGGGVPGLGRDIAFVMARR